MSLGTVLGQGSHRSSCSKATAGPGLLQDIFREAGDEANLNVYVQPNLGFLQLVCMWLQRLRGPHTDGLSTFLAATFCSLIAGHITTACHRYAHKLGEFGVEEDGLPE